MGIRSILSKPLAKLLLYNRSKWIKNPVETQEKVFQQLVKIGSKTAFGADHHFNKIQSTNDYAQNVPIRDYEGLKPYIERVVAGEKDVLWKGLPIYFAKTSGTTSGVKYIPISKESIPYHISSARDALLSYVRETGNSKFLDGSLIFLSGSPVLDLKGAVPTGRLSGIVNHHVPGYLRSNQKPSYNTNCIEDWESKVDAIVNETIHERMTLISGIPPWVQMYFDNIVARTGKQIKDVFPDFSVFVYGGVNFEPYKNKLFETIGKKIDSIETYPASEGFIAYQDSQNEAGLLLLLNNGIFYEFIPLDSYGKPDAPRLTIGEVELGVNYALIMTTNAGLWAYSIGDTVKFVSKNPYRILVTGRVKHFISAFGEHVIGEEVEKAMRNTCLLFPEVELTEFTVAPYVSDNHGKSYHEWLVEFAKVPHDIHAFRETLDAEMVKANVYYKDLITGNILSKLVITTLQKNAFIDFMKSEGKLGGQNKVPRLSNDRNLADKLSAYKIA
jgi:hypothetical protein